MLNLYLTQCTFCILVFLKNYRSCGLKVSSGVRLCNYAKKLISNLQLYTEKKQQCSFVPRQQKSRYNVSKGLHDLGPPPFKCQEYFQYNRMPWGNFLYSVNNFDNCVRVGDHLCLIRNILQKGIDLVFFYELLTSVTDYFSCPLLSSDFGILKVSKLSACFYATSFVEIRCNCKYIELSCKNSFVAIPILHCYNHI